jgi:hypothetical protein
LPLNFAIKLCLEGVTTDPRAHSASMRRMSATDTLLLKAWARRQAALSNLSTERATAGSFRTSVIEEVA